MTIDQYLADVAFCHACGQGLRETFQIVGVDDGRWHIKCLRCSHTFHISHETLEQR